MIYQFGLMEKAVFRTLTAELQQQPSSYQVAEKSRDVAI